MRGFDGDLQVSLILVVPPAEHLALGVDPGQGGAVGKVHIDIDHLTPRCPLGVEHGHEPIDPFPGHSGNRRSLGLPVSPRIDPRLFLG